MGKLFVVATPLGNLKDITLRALEVLREVDLVVAEDSREARKLLTAFEVKKDILTYNQHSSDQMRLKIFELLQAGQNIALITDAGTPGISDPGNELISFLTTFQKDIQIVTIPGPSSVTALLSVCGFPTQHFSFFGFFPKKKKTKLLLQMKALTHPFVFFESPHRIVKTLEELLSYFPKETPLVLGRELTKIHETIYRGTIETVLLELKNMPSVKGELVVVVHPTAE